MSTLMDSFLEMVECEQNFKPPKFKPNDKCEICTYKGYRAYIEYNTEDKIYVGTVLDIDDIIGFHGNTMQEAKKSFENTMEDYFDFCKQIGKEPYIPK